MHYKNKNTGEIGFFGGIPNKNWTLANKEEINVDNLQKQKVIKINQLAQNRERLSEKSVVIYNDKFFANSQNARIAINDARQSMTASSPAVSYFTYPVNETGNLIAEQREIVEFTKADFTALADLIRNNERNLREREIALIIDINDCSDLSDLELININLQ